MKTEYKVTDEDIKMLKLNLSEQTEWLSETKIKLKNIPKKILLTGVVLLLSFYTFEFNYSFHFFSTLFLCIFFFMLRTYLSLRKEYIFGKIMFNLMEYVYNDCLNSYYDATYISPGFPSDKVLGRGLIK